MGVDYSTTVAYGYAFKNDTLPELFKSRYDSGDEDDVVELLREKGVNTDIIGFEVGGNAWSGDNVYLFYVKSFGAKRMEYDDNETLFSFGPVRLTFSENTEVTRLAGLVFGGDSFLTPSPVWHLVQNVS